MSYAICRMNIDKKDQEDTRCKKYSLEKPLLLSLR